VPGWICAPVFSGVRLDTTGRGRLRPYDFTFFADG
jgi:hypothetical protein